MCLCEMFNSKYVIIAVRLEHNKVCPEGPGWRDYLPCRLMTLDAKQARVLPAYSITVCKRGILNIGVIHG